MRKAIMKISIVAVLVTGMAMSISPALAESSSPENTEVGISIESGGDITAVLELNADGTVSLIVDGVPLQEKFQSIDDAMNGLSSRMNNLSKKTKRRFEEAFNRLDIVLQNTKYNREQHEVLEKNYERFKIYINDEIVHLEFVDNTQRTRLDAQEEWISNNNRDITGLEDRCDELEKRNTILIIALAGVAIVTAFIGITAHIKARE